MTFIDFYFLELCDFVHFITEYKFYEEQKSVARYVKRMKGLPLLMKYAASDRFLSAPYNNKVAKINNLKE